MKYTNKFLGALCLAAFGFASCADDYSLLDYEGIEQPVDMAAYEYLKDYNDLKTYVDRTASPNFKLGAGVTVSSYNEGGIEYRMANTNFDEVTPGNAMKHASVVGNDGSMNFDAISSFVANAKAGGQTIYGHTLAWHAQQNKKYLNSLIAPIIIPGEPVEGGDGGHSLELKNETGDGNNGWSAQTWYVFDKALTNGSTYTLSFWVKGTEDFTLGAWFKMGADGEQIYHQPGNYNVTTEWTEVTNTFTVGNDGVDRFIFNFGNFNPEGAIYIDKIQFVEEGATENWIKNDDFEEGHTDGWAYWTPGKNYAVSEDGKGYSTGGEPGYSMRIKNESGNGSDNWSGQVWYVLEAPLVNGTTYTLSFMAKGTEAYTMGSWLKVGGDGEQIYHQPGNCNITTDWTEVSNTFTVGKDGVDRFIFNFGNYNPEATIFIDDIKLVEDGGDENLIKNGDFEEQHVDGWAYWTPGKNYAISELGEGYVDNGPSDIIIEKTPEEKKALLTEALDKWVAGIMAATEGYVSTWDVVNEPISGADKDGDGFYDLWSAKNVSEADAKNNFYWQDYLGNEAYVPTVIKMAQKYYTGDTKLKLFINDYNLESDWDDNKKLKSLIHWIEVWEKSDIIKIDGIGTQMHVSYYANPATQASKEAAIENMFKLMAETGKLVKISELDMGYVDANGNSVKTANMTEEQHMAMAEFYKFIIKKYFEIIPAAQQYGITQWCLNDAPDNSGWRGGEPVGLWDANNNRKHVYAGFADGLAGVEDEESTPETGEE